MIEKDTDPHKVDTGDLAKLKQEALQDWFSERAKERDLLAGDSSQKPENRTISNS